MIRRLFPIIAVLAAASLVSAADYMFPSPRPPANLAPSNASVKQYVAVIFDDNAYSGGSGTQYEPLANATYAQMGWVNGTGGGTNNPFNITETVNPIGIAWAKNTIGSKTNPGGAKIHMTFNLITGVFCPTWGPSWQDRRSKFGAYYDPAQPYVAGVSGFDSISRSWGREFAVGLTQASNNDVQKDAITPMDSSLIKAGFEIGNHTIDHMEPNSPLPNNALGFGIWAGEGFDPGVDRDNEGNPISPDEQTQYGLPANSWALTNGWEMDAGKKLSITAWKGAIALGEAQLKQYLHMTGAGTDIFGFRSPRLESNSNQFFALKQLNYQYDDGLEEGYEETMDGTNPIWPYTLDNGSPNDFVQKSNGEKIYLDSMPAALWELPLDAVVVPVALRPGIYSKYRQISLGAGDTWAAHADSVAADSLAWIANGKITALDFNMFVLWGMTGPEFLQTMIYNLDARLQHGKAPMQLGCHTDYYTPIYDNATLQMPINASGYGLIVSKGWSTYLTRQAAVSAFLDTAIKRGCYVVSGHELIEALKTLQASQPAVVAETLSGTWTYANALGTSTTTLASAIGDHFGPATVTFNGADIDCGYMIPVAAGALTGLTDISLTYQTSEPLEVRLICGNITYKALLNNLGGSPKASGIIPMSAFVRDDTTGYTPPVNVSLINGLEIAPVAVGAAHPAATFTVSNLRTYGVKLPLAVSSSMLSSNVVKLTMNKISSARVMFTAPTAGSYMVRMYALDGKMIQSCNVNVPKTGVASAAFTAKLSASMYIIKISGNGTQCVAKTLVTAGL
jgi:hypothetical protein